MEKIKYIIEYDVDIEDKFIELPKSVREVIRKAIEKKIKVDPLTFGKLLRYIHKQPQESVFGKEKARTIERS